MIVNLFTVNQPKLGTDVFHPVERAAVIFLHSVYCPCGFQFCVFGIVQNIGFTGYKQGRAASGKEIEPLAVHVPVDRTRNTDAVTVNHVENAVLHQSECDRVYPHFSGTIPFKSAGIVTGSVQFIHSGYHVRECITADDHAVITGRFADSANKVEIDLGRGSRPIPERPAAIRHGGFHLHTPFVKEIEGGKIVLDELVSPFAEHSGRFFNVFDDLGNRRIEERGSVFLIPMWLGALDLMV